VTCSEAGIPERALAERKRDDLGEMDIDDRAQRVVPVLFLPATNRQHMVEAKAGIPLPEPQHRLQIVRRESEVDDVLCELHLPCRQLEDVSASRSETSQSLAAVAVLRAWGMIRAGAGAPR
jgi:hypothetical protein